MYSVGSGMVLAIGNLADDAHHPVRMASSIASLSDETVIRPPSARRVPAEEGRGAPHRGERREVAVTGGTKSGPRTRFNDRFRVALRTARLRNVGGTERPIAEQFKFIDERLKNLHHRLCTFWQDATRPMSASGPSV